VRFTGTGTNTLTLQTGSVLNGEAVGSTATGATNQLVLEGHGQADNNFTNFTSLDVRANSFWVLNGKSTVGAAAINGGTLEVCDASHLDTNLTTNVTVNSGGQLVGQSRITGGVDVTSGGLLSPGAVHGTAIGALTVTGNVNFTTGSTFGINASGDGRSSKLSVGGTATLTGGNVDVRAGGTFAPSMQYTILSAAGGLGGTMFGGVTSNLAFLTPTLTHGTNDVTLTLACNNPGACSNGTSGGGTAGGGTGTGGGSTLFGFASVAHTPNQSAVATALDGGPTSNRLVTAVLNQSVDGARQAFNALSGEAKAGAQALPQAMYALICMPMTGQAAPASTACSWVPMQRVGSASSTCAAAARIHSMI